jgi:hypothetical protein
MGTTLDDPDDFSINTIDQPVAIIDPTAPIWSKIPRQPLRLTYIVNFPKFVHSIL